MNNLKTYFASPGKRRTNGTAVLLLPAVSATELSTSGIADTAVDKVAQLEIAKENGADIESIDSTSPLYIIKKPSVDSKLILQNMEEVLNSVKKKHRQKHRRKKEQKKLAQLEAEAVAVAIKTKADQEIVTLKLDIDATLSKKPLSEKTEQVINGGVPQVSKSKSRHTPMKKNPIKSVSPNGNLLKNITLNPKIDETIISMDEEREHINKSGEKVDCLKKTSAKPNAFEVLMNARNKSIGSNTSGKEMSAEEDTTGEATAAAVKRKLLLQDWAERKGGAKRKLEEESRTAYVEKQLETRAKRFKKMLVAGCGAKPVDNSIENPSENHRNKKFKKKKARVKLNIEENEVEEAKRTRGTIRRQRVASVESAEESSPPVASFQQVDSETIDSIAQPSSPKKKSDSLLGYFPKKESPNLSENKKNEESKDTSLAKEPDATPKRPRRLAAKRAIVDVEGSAKEPQSEQNGETTPLNTKTISDRPRRSCAGKARYDYDLQVSPTKCSKTPKTAKTPKPSTIHTNKPDGMSGEELEIIDLVDGKSETPSQQKLAPLFVRSVPKPSPDPDLIKARHAFLMSGVPDKMRIEQFKQKQLEQSYEEAWQLYPKISHVQQLTADELKWVTENFSLSFALKSVEDEPSISKNRHSKAKKSREIRHITGSHEHAPFSFPSLFKQPLPQVPEKRLIIKAWKTKYERFPIYRCYNQMREKYRYFNAIDSAQDTEQVTESFVVTRRNSRRSLQLAEQNESDASSDDAKPPAMAPNGELMFTEKYKPLLFEQFLVNLSPVAELREFLANCSAGIRNPQGIDDIDFDDSNSSNSSQQAFCNTIVLMGPSSSGKTSSVFAVANELNFNVLEINAGMKRTGKKLIQELHEATQSHQLRKNAPTLVKAQKSLLKMSLNGLKSKAKKSNSKGLNGDDGPSSPSSADAGSSVARKCLILIEDADIVFDQMDAGFTDAIYTLAASSKRPVIIVASDENCPHLQRLIQQNTIYFKEPSTLNISRYMAVLALLENCPVNLDDLISLYIYNKKDLRKTLLELQFFTQSGGDGKKKEQEDEQVAVSLYVSPNKRRFSEESGCLQGTDNDDVPNKETSAARSDADSKLYIHQNLFNFFTLPQNEKWRIPFPVDFDLLRHNLDKILRSSRNLSDSGTHRIDKRTKPAEPTTKRKSRSPKKVWLTAAAQQTMPLADLCDFYDNLSIACLLGTHGKESPSTKGSTRQFNDQLLPHLVDDIVHSMVASAIDHNLEAQEFSNNFIYAPLKKISLVDCLGNVALRSKRVLALEFEPTLRSICRSEKLRATNERRSTRFYHYLRNSLTNPDERLEVACSVFIDDPSGSQVNCEEGTPVDSTTSQ